MLYSKEADDIFNELLPLREKMSVLAGYDSYREYGYSNRFFQLAEVEKYIENVKQTILPVYQKLAVNGQGRTSRCPASRYVKSVALLPEDMYKASIQVLRNTLDEISPMIDYLERNEMIDAMPRMGKDQRAGGTRFLTGQQIPFVSLWLPNPDVMIHEFGHAFEFFKWPDMDLSNRFSNTTESTEVSSLCMEALATTQYELLYGDTSDYARMSKVYTMTEDMLAETMLCEFELELYANPDMALQERNKLFDELKKEYQLEKLFPQGWVSVSHLFTAPMYTISYSIDDGVALNLMGILQDDSMRAKEIYLNYIHSSTQRNFVTRLKNAGLSNPAEKQTLEKLAEFLESYFSSDDYQNPAKPQ